MGAVTRGDTETIRVARPIGAQLLFLHVEYLIWNVYFDPDSVEVLALMPLWRHFRETQTWRLCRGDSVCLVWHCEERLCWYEFKSLGYYKGPFAVEMPHFVWLSSQKMTSMKKLSGFPSLDRSEMLVPSERRGQLWRWFIAWSSKTMSL